MRRLLKGKKGLSQVVTTLIILVVAVLLATVVCYYAINMTTTRVQEEDLRITDAHIWANSTVAEAAFVIVNIGGRDTLINKIQVRGQDIPWGNTVHYERTSTAPTSDLTYNSSFPSPFQNATAELSLKSGECLVIYIQNPGTISVQDIGTTCSITVFTANAQYEIEVNIQSAS